MPFMLPHYEEGFYWKVDTDCGLYYVPSDFFLLDVDQEQPDDKELLEFVEGDEINSVEMVHGIGAWLAAPGYLDRTDLTVHDTQEEAEQYITETYDVDPKTGEDLNDER